MSLGSWNKLESLLLDATTKPTASTTPKTIPKLDEVTHPHLLRCVRHKKSLKFSRGPMRSGEFIASCKEISVNDSGIIPSKVKLGVSKTYTAIRDTPMPKSTVGLENCDEYSQEEREVSIEMNNEEYEENEEEPAENYQNNHRIGSLDMELIYRDGRATEAAQRKMQELARHASMDETLAMKTYKPVCGIEDHHLRELYRLKCRDLKIGSFADSEESFLTGTKKKSSGFKLSFLESGFGPRAIEKLGQIIRDNSEITQLVLRKSVLTGTNIRSFARNLSLMPSLIHLELANNSMEPQDFAILFEELANSKTLISIDISNYEPDKKNRFTMECLPAFKKFVQGSVYLQYVTMVSLMLEDELMQELLATLEQCPNLLSLNVASNNSSGKALERLTNVISQTSVCHLDLSHNKLKREGAQHLAKAIQNLKGPGREGVNLVLENTHLGIDVNYIFAAFGRDTNVAKLNLGQNFLCGLEIIRLESALSEGSKLQELNFSNCKLGEIGGKILALGLSKNSWLQSLILVNNDLGDSIAAGIIHAVTHNHSLRQLDLSQNKLASESAKALQDLIKKNPNVEKYNLHLNKINEKEGYLLQEALYFNSKIIQFNIHHNPVKYNTIETVERIVKDNLKKLRFHAVPKLKTEVAKKRVFIQDEKHNVSQAIEMEKVKGEVKRDVDKFQKTLTALRNRSESPTIKKNEKLIMKLGKDIKSYNVEQNDAIIEVREFGNEACLERDMYKNEIDNIAVNIKQVSNKVDEKRKDIEDVKEKYEPEIRKLRLEINRLKKDNQFLELYNETITKKIKKEKKKAALSSRLPNPKISDIFLASSELARHKRKNPEIQDTTHNQVSRSRLGVVMETHSEISHTTDNSKIKREYNFAMKNQQFRISKVMKENERGQSQKKKKKTAPKGDGSELDIMKQRIKEKIKNLIKVNETPDNILGQIADNEQQQQPLQV